VKNRLWRLPNSKVNVEIAVKLVIREHNSLSTAVMAEHQRKDTTLARHIKCHPEYFTKQADVHDIILLNKKIYIPTILWKEILKWYHTTLHHPGIVRIEKI
jgi:hypothetical protein